MDMSSINENRKIEKPKITCRLVNGKEYYSVEYYNPFDKETHIGYSSFCKSYTQQWLNEDFINIPILDIEKTIREIENLKSKLDECNKLQAELQTYKDKLADGRMVELPCKVGDTVYVFTSSCVRGEKEFVDKEYMCRCHLYPCGEHTIVKLFTVPNLKWIIENIKNIGISVFLTLTEAEQALKKMDGK